jgi:hypothetical protein
VRNLLTGSSIDAARTLLRDLIGGCVRRAELNLKASNPNEPSPQPTEPRNAKQQFTVRQDGKQIGTVEM